MTNFDPELIAALAEGALSPEEAAALEARVMADPAARAELEGQRMALAALRAAPAPRMDDMERARLHRAVAAELDVIRPRAAPTPKRRFSLPWAGLATAAAVLLFVVAAAPLLSLLSTSGGDSASDATVGADVTAASPAAESAPVEDDLAVTRHDLAPANTFAASQAAPADEGGQFADPDGIVDFGELTRADFEAEVIQRLAVISRFESADGEPQDATGFGPLICDQVVRERRPPTEQVEPLGVGTLEGVAVEVYLVSLTGEPDDQLVVAVDAGTCDLVFEVR